MMIDFSDGFATQLERLYFRESLPSIIRLRIYEPITAENSLVYQLVLDSMKNILDNHPLYKGASVAFLKNVDKRLDFWLDIIAINIRERIKEIITDFMSEYEEEANNQ